MNKPLPKAEAWLRHFAALPLWGGLWWACRRMLAGMLTRSFALTLLGVIIAGELCLLGIGVVRRLEIAAAEAREAAREELAAIETQAFAGEYMSRAGSVGIGAAAEGGVPPEEEADTAAAPPMRARDVATIVAQETGELLDSDLSDAPVQETKTSGSGHSAPNAAIAEAMGTLSEEESQEVDELIRKGVAAMVAGDMRLCILCFEQVKDLAPKHPAMLYYYGMAYDKLLNPAKAREYYTSVFNMRDRAGKYFQRASRRLTYGFEQPSDMRGKLSFGPYHCNHVSGEDGEKVEIALPVLLAPGESVRAEDIYINVQFFVLVNNRRIEFSRFNPTWAWQNKKPDWSESEENLTISHTIPTLTPEERDAYGDMVYYGFTAKLYYKDEPLDCISSPSALILQEQRLNNRRAIRRSTQPGGLFPDEEPASESATPFSEFLEELEQPAS